MPAGKSDIRGIQTPLAEDVRKDKEELAFLRQKASSLMMRGHYRECFKLVEDNMPILYHKERWPENFLSMLRNHKRCFSSMDITQPYDDYLRSLLKKHGIPAVFVSMLKSSGTTIVWTADYFKDLVMALQSKGEYAQALDYSEILLKMDPLNSSALLLKGWLLNQLGQPTQAMSVFEQAVEMNPSNYQAWHSLARHYQSSNPKKALECVDKALHYQPGDSEFIGTKAKILLDTGDRAGAMECYDQAAQSDPLNAEYPYQKGELLLEEGQTLAAMRQFSKSVSNDERHLPSLRRLAQLFAESQQDQALECLNTICTLDPEDRESALFRARLLRQKGEPRLAARQYHNILQYDPKCAEALGGLGDLYLPEDVHRALSFYDRALELNHKNPQLHLGKGKAHEKLGEIPEALQEFETTVVLDKACAEAWGSLGLLQVKEKPALALECLNKALSLAPENPYYHHGKGEALLLTGKPDEAMDALSYAVKLDPGNAEIHVQMGRLLEAVHNQASALEHYRLAASLDIYCAPAFGGIARLIRLTEPDDALIQINTAISLDGINGEYYFQKCKILMQLYEDEAAMGRLRGNLRVKYFGETAREIKEIVDGECLKMALVYIDRAIELVARNSAYLCTRGDLLALMGMKSKALAQYEQALELERTNYKALYGIGCILAEKSDKKALEYFDKALAVNPKSYRCNHAKAALLAKDPATYKQALASYDIAISLGDRPWPAILEKARLLDSGGELAEAQEHYRRVLLLNRDCLEATARLGEVLAQHGVSTGLSYLDHAEALDPENNQYAIRKARLLYALGRGGEAQAECRKAVALGKGSPETYFSLAEILAKPQSESALDFIEHAVSANPGKAEYQLLKGDLLLSLGRWEESKEAYNQVLRLQSKNHEALAKISLVMGPSAKAEALEAINQALRLSSDCTQYLSMKAKLLADTFDENEEGDTSLQQAVQCATEAVKREPDSLEYNEQLVELLERTKATVKLMFARRKLEKCRRRQQELLESVQAMEDFPEEQMADPQMGRPAVEG